MAYCEDCGTRLSDGICPNCSEELFIFDTQYEFMDQPISDEFMEKVSEQQNKESQRIKQP